VNYLDIMKQALEALESCDEFRHGGMDYKNFDEDAVEDAKNALRLAIKQAEHEQREAELSGVTSVLMGRNVKPEQAENQEPVAWQWLTTAHFRKKLPKDAEPGAWTPLYTAPPQRQSEQEPVAWVNANHLQGLTLGHYGYAEIYTDESLGRIPLYAAPPQRNWVKCCCGEPETLGVVHRTDGPCYWPENAPPQRQPLTDLEIISIPEQPSLIDFARAIEAAHGIR
jgi:hypothetical protein